MKTFKELVVEKLFTSTSKFAFKNLSDKELKKWLEDNWTDEAGIGQVFAGQLKNASKEASKRKLKWTKK